MKVPAYTLVNTGLSYAFKLNNRDATLNGNINNLFNKKYWAGGGWGAGNMGKAINGSVALKVKW
jgi:iron complex outermembrane receptor protein